MENQNESSIFDLQIDHETNGYLIEIAKWAKLFSILGLIAGILIVLAGIVTSFVSTSLNSFAGMRGMGPLIGVLSIIFGAVYLYPSWLLLKFATTMPKALNKNDQLLVNEAFKNLKSCFKFWGIFTLIVIGLYLIIFVLGLIGQMI